MTKYILNRVINILPTLLIVAIIVFGVTRILPGDPAAAILGPQANASEIENMRTMMGLNKPIWEQFFDYIVNLFQGDLGFSYAYNMNVVDLILDRFPNTVILTIASLFIALVIGIPAGLVSAYKRNSIIDYIVMVISLIGVSMPVFWLGVMLVLVFSVNMGILPSTGMGDWSQGASVFFSHLLLPSITLATIPMANFARITRSSMLEVLSQDYIRTARAKGIKENLVIRKHALKNALNPILSVLGLQVAALLGGSILTETIFSWPGMGRLVTDAINRGDFGVVQGVVIFVALIYVLTNLIIDLLYKVVNPRISYTGGGK